MPKIRFLKIRFNQNIFPSDIPRFRAAVIEKTERKKSLFHNHKNETEVIYRYPLIQYKVTNKIASIVCLNEGADEIHHLFQAKDLTLTVGSKVNDYAIEDVDIHFQNVQTWETSFHYSLHNWLALNQEHHKRFKELETNEAEQIKLLESILKGNILSFAKGIDWHVDHPIILNIEKIKELKLLPFKNQRVLAISINFSCNVSLPDFIGLGKGASLGFGIIKGFNN